MRARARGMTCSMVRIGLFKTQGLDEYGTAAVGWLRGAGLKATEGPAEQRGGGIQMLTHTFCYAQHTLVTHGSHTHRQYNLSHEQQRCNSRRTKFPSQPDKKSCTILHAKNSDSNIKR